MRTFASLMVITVLMGCGMDDGGEPADGAEGGSSTGAVGATTSDDPPDPSVTSDTTVGPGGDTSDGGETTEGGDTTGGEPASVCDPQPMDVGPFAIGLDYDPEEPLLDHTVELDVTCTVATITSSFDELSIDLDCEDALHVLDVSGFELVDLAVGDVVTLRAFDVQPWWRETFVALLRNDQVIVAGMNGSMLPSGAGSSYGPPGTFFDPLGIEVVPNVCRPEPRPEPDDEPCDFICTDPCYQVERQALELESGGRSIVVYDANVGSVDGLQIGVESAHTRVNVQCADTASAWYRFVVVRRP
jgi:hypothetical protein